MPKIMPQGGEVSWPANEGTLGVVGVAPWATMDFCRTFYQKVTARKDWHYPRVLLDINSKLPSRGRHLQLGEKDPSPDIAATIRELADQGATVAVVVCNTAHILFDRWAADLPIPVLNIVDETVKLASAGDGKQVTPLVSNSLATSDIYGKAAEAAGLKVHRVGKPYQDFINGFIESVKTTGDLKPADRASVESLIAHLKAEKIETVVLGCTELSVLQQPLSDAGFNVIDSNDALANAAIARIQKS
jgi:aspartate racemase